MSDEKKDPLHVIEADIPEDGKAWVAKIKGTDDQYGLKRWFVNSKEADAGGDLPGPGDHATFEIDEPGVYQYRGAGDGELNGFVAVEPDGKVEELGEKPDRGALLKRMSDIRKAEKAAEAEPEAGAPAP